MASPEEIQAQHKAQFDKLAADLTTEQRAALTAAADQLDAQVDALVAQAGGMLHHMYLEEYEALDRHGLELRASIDALDHADLVTVAGRLAVVLAGHRFRFTGQDR
ncbi:MULTISPECIES: hypothetical protein [Microbacterium]|uniref:Uncharacterized protein n=1 Tax=Microbacterium maritypicum MF109 TaxID=1333857 RepID=T5KFV0_MICMQ|nr:MULTISPECIES: hypothetical protein [Microbacterium]EQM75930.1 hypothetical protein L687_18645 [Microbacterium maritypicum MF109]